jgi:hypothetical protein
MVHWWLLRTSINIGAGTGNFSEKLLKGVSCQDNK